MLPYRDSRLTYIALGIFFLAIGIYAYYESRGLLFGPTITVGSAVTEVHEPLVYVEGKSERISSLLLNGRPISVTEKGEFNEPYLLTPGYNRIVLDARDKYGHSSRKVVEIIYRADGSPYRSAPSSASSSPVAP